MISPFSIPNSVRVVLKMHFPTKNGGFYTPKVTSSIPHIERRYSMGNTAVVHVLSSRNA